MRQASNYPAAAAYIVNVVMAALVAFHFLSQTTAATVATVVVALTSLVVAFMVHPFVWAAASGALQTLLVGLAGFGLHWSDQQISTVVALAGFVAAVVTHTLVIPVSARRRGTTVAEIERSAARA